MSKITGNEPMFPFNTSSQLTLLEATGLLSIALTNQVNLKNNPPKTDNNE